MSDDLFDGPGSSSGISWEEINGRLLLITPHSVETGIKTSYGDTDAVRADVVVLDGPDAPDEYADTLIFPRVLQGQVRKNAGTGRMNLGRLGQGNKKPGQSPPWMLGDPTDADKAIARNYLAQNSQPPF
ncbi:hypothetical protein ACFQE5_22210 [Pseudonocardia hispaniensis]|uniref:Uncharacterized protein n=1 Tax=Pseudonocardia hispaniensis TaxID=904933 RepID=A0ABW1J7Q8_9PSEU